MTGTGETPDAAYDDAPIVLIFDDGDGGGDAAAVAATAAGARIAGTLPIVEGAARLATQLAVDAVVVEAGNAPEDALGALLTAVERGARSGTFAAIVVATLDQLDTVAARVGGDVTLLCAPTARDRVLALREAVRRPPSLLHDIGGEAAAARLIQLTEEVGRLARSMATQGAVPAAGTAPPYAISPSDAAQLRLMIRNRRLREQFFAPELFADPAWDMLLDLMAARLEQRRVAVSSLCIAAAVPPTTALRWIKTMTDLGLLVRGADPTDARRIFIALSDESAAAMAGWLGALQR